MPEDGEARDHDVVPGEGTMDEIGQGGSTEPGLQPEDIETSRGAAEDDITPEAGPSDEDRIAKLEVELEDVRDQLLRKSADFENYRKRMQREKEEFASYANRELLLDLVPIVDDFERAIRSSEESQDFALFHDGIMMIERQFTQMLERKWKLTRFESVGEEFDPQRHEAMMTEPVAGHDRSMVLEDFQKGYTLNDRVLRPAKVKVSMPAEPASGEASGGADEASKGHAAE